MSERKTEALVRRHFDQYASEVDVEEQASDDPNVAKLLARASKSGGGGAGRPEFLIHFHQTEGLIGVVGVQGVTLAAPEQHPRPT